MLPGARIHYDSNINLYKPLRDRNPSTRAWFFIGPGLYFYWVHFFLFSKKEELNSIIVFLSTVNSPAFNATNVGCDHVDSIKQNQCILIQTNSFPTGGNFYELS